MFHPNIEENGMLASKALFDEIIPEDQMLPDQEPFNKYRSEIPIQPKNIQKAKDLLALVPSHLWQNKIFEVSINIHKKFRNLSYGSKILKKSEVFLKKKSFIISKIKKSNKSSLKIFKRNNYKIIDKNNKFLLIKII
jgi:hypothetical protein